ncbi:hypothetical protein SAMN04490178_101298 [Propionispora vibrioides]|uniref:Uncharacterized protein n=1 Tax=Propionispora vibrioides TaxID=112903 RepID=A0A1H8P0Z4_9FIRM|nr:hypothetical protein SAMN04490178_101298 [Propionispora vibrioides]
MSILTTVFLLGMMAVLFPKLNNAIFASSTEHNSLSAQYAAESGAKKAISTFYQSSQDWKWLNSWQDIGDAQYNVQISPVPSSPATAGAYTVTSTGREGNSSKTTHVTVTVSGGDPTGPAVPSGSDYAMYSDSNIILSGNLLLHGKLVAKGTVTRSGTVNYGDHDSAIIQNPKEKWWFADYNTFKTAKTAQSFLDSTNRPINTKITRSSDLTGQNYNNQTIIINGDLTMAGNKSFNNTTLLVSGNITYSGTMNFNSNCLVVAGNSITMSGSNLGGAVYISYGSITYSGILNGGAVYAKGNITSSGNNTITYSKEAMNYNQLIDDSSESGSASTVEVGTWY